MSTLPPKKFQELLARVKAKQSSLAATVDAISSQASSCAEIDLSMAGIPPISSPEEEDAAVDIIQEIVSTLSPEILEEKVHAGKQLGVTRDVTLNEKQQQFCDKVITGADAVLIGAAGTGKTTSMKRTTQALIDSNILPELTVSTKALSQGMYGAAIISFTRKAVNNIRHAVVDELKANTMTIHKLLEFAPIFYEIEDKISGGFKKTMKFEPQRCLSNPLPPELVFLAYEESSMISVELYALLQAALPHPHQEVFLGDIQQLPPIFGSAILGFKMLELDVIELTEVYRQALNSPIINLAWAILSGKRNKFNPATEEEDNTTAKGKKLKRKFVPALREFESTSEYGTLVFQPWQKKLAAEQATLALVGQFHAWQSTGYYNPEEDMILCPFNQALGTLELNKGISNFLGKQRHERVHEVIAGFNFHYLAVGDRVLYDKEDAVITQIVRNGEYSGRSPQTASVHLDRWGCMQEEVTEAEVMDDMTMDTSSLEDFMLSADLADITDRVQSASHVVHVRLVYEDKEVTLSKAAEVNALLGGYAITVHKSQGSEWDNVFFVMHHSHANMCQRELLYTGVTRAKKRLHFICEADTLYKGVASQKIIGNSLSEKSLFFRGKLDKIDETETYKAGDAYTPTVYIRKKHHEEASLPKSYEAEEIASAAEVGLAGIAEREAVERGNPQEAGETASGSWTRDDNTVKELERAAAKEAALAKLAAIRAKRRI